MNVNAANNAIHLYFLGARLILLIDLIQMLKSISYKSTWQTHHDIFLICIYEHHLSDVHYDH